MEKGILVGYDKYSPAYNVYYPETGKVITHRLVKFITKGNTGSQTQTDCDMGDNIESYEDTLPKMVNQGQGQPKESNEFSVGETAVACPTQRDSRVENREKRVKNVGQLHERGDGLFHIE